MGYEYELSRILDNASSQEVCEALGVEMEQKGSKISILCPCHEDTHFGNCFLTPKGFHCFACNEKGSLYDLVMKTMKCSFRSAVKFVANTCGGENKYRKDIFCSLESGLAPLSRKEKALLGFLQEEGCSNRVYRVIAYVPSGTWELQKDEKILDEFPEGEECVWYSIIGKLADPNPLMTLMREDEKSYTELVRNKSAEMYAKALMLVGLLDTKPIPSDAMSVRLCLAIIGDDRAKEILQARILALNETFIRHGGESHTELSYYQEASGMDVPACLTKYIPPSGMASEDVDFPGLQTFVNEMKREWYEKTCE